jgi:protein SCO1/2
MTTRGGALAWALITLAFVPACSRKPAPKQYPLEGQILAVATTERQLTIKHGDIPDFMPGMTMSFPVADPKLLEGRTPGELITATLEVENGLGRITAITHVGSAPLPPSNEGALAELILNIGDAVPDAALIDQTNARRSLSEWKGAYSLVTFIYTRCPLPNFCPLMDQNFRTLQGELIKDARLRDRVKLISITLDPEHDTPEVLTTHSRKLEADANVWTFLTGDRVTIDRVAARFGVNVIRDPADPVQINHGLRTAIVSPDRRLTHTYTGNDWTPGDILADLRAAVRVP